MKGFLSLPADIVADDETLAAWVGRAATHASTLPAKKPKKPKKP
jgi:hypothetical protein